MSLRQYQLSTTSGSISSITSPQISGDSGWYDSGASIIVVYNYSWNLTAAQSRTDAISYSVDHSASTSLQRSGGGTFPVQVVMTAPHSIAVQSVTQYLLTVSGGSSVVLSETSPTQDYFYDTGSSITATTGYTWNVINGNTRQNLISYTLDGRVTNVTRAQSGSFTTPVLTFSSPHQLAFNFVTQYLISFSFEDSSGTTAVQPASAQIQLSDPALITVNDSQAWLDSGTSFQIHTVIWESADVTPTGATVYSVTGATTEKIPLRIYAAEIIATDYLGIPISGASVTVTLVNGTTLQKTTGSDGVARFGLIPVGIFQGKLSYLGATTSIAGDASTQASTPVKILVSYSFLLMILVVVALAAAGAALLVRRRQKSKKAQELLRTPGSGQGSTSP